jgi:hypothetical protein
MPCGVRVIDQLTGYHTVVASRRYGIADNPCIPAAFGNFFGGLQKTMPESISPPSFTDTQSFLSLDKKRYSSGMPWLSDKPLPITLRQMKIKI